MSFRSILTPAIAAVAVGSVASFASAAPNLYGIMFRAGGQTAGLFPNLYDVNPLTGAATNPRPVNVGSIVGVAADPSNGVLYGLTDQISRFNNQSGTGGRNLIVTINPATGAAAAVGQISPSGGPLQVFEGDLAFSPTDGELYATRSLNGVGSLIRVNRLTPETSVLVGNLDVPNVDASAMAFAPNGDLYVLNTTIPNPNTTPAILYRVNPANAQVLETRQLDLALGNVAGMAFNPDNNQLLVTDGDTGGTDNLFRVNFATNTLDLIGATGATAGIYQGLAGLSFAPVPEPTTLLAAGGATALVARRRR